jgi:hypothetical protein
MNRETRILKIRNVMSRNSLRTMNMKNFGFEVL